MNDQSNSQRKAIAPLVSLTPETPKAPPHPLDNDWFMHEDGNTYGPFSGRKMQEFARDGRLNGDTQVARVGSDAWIQANEERAFRGFFDNHPVLQSGRTATNPDRVSASEGSTIVQVTNNIPSPSVYIEDGVAKPKSAGTALILSLLLVGLGQIYNGQVGKGLLMFVACVLLWFALLGWIINLWSMIDAYKTASSMNRRYERRLAAGLI